MPAPLSRLLQSTSSVIFVCLAFILHCSKLSAQEPAYQVQAFRSQLSDVKLVSGIAGDRNNCIWFATQAGIYRYDGSRFRHYSVRTNPVLQFERLAEISALHGRKGYNWIFRDYKGNSYCIDSLSRIVRYVHDPGKYDKLLFYKFDIPQLDPKNVIKRDPAFAGSIMQTHVLPLKDRVFLYFFDGSIRTMPYDAYLRGEKGDSVYKLPKPNQYKALHTEKHFFLITRQGIRYWDETTKKFQSAKLRGHINTVHPALDFDHLSNIACTDPRTILFSYEGCLYEVKTSDDGQALDTKLLVKDPLKRDPLFAYYSPGLRVLFCYYNITGLALYRPRRFQLLSWDDPAHGDKQDDYYYCILPDGDGVITSISKGIFRLGLDGSKEMIHAGTNTRFFMFKDRDGAIWHQGFGRQVSRLVKGVGKKWTVEDFDAPGDLAGGYQTDENTVYILTHKRFYRFHRVPGGDYIPEILTDPVNGSGEFTVLYEFSPGTFWLGTDQGLFSYEMSSRKLTEITPMRNRYIRSVIRLEKDNYLVGTYDKGIFQYIDHQWIPFPSASGRLGSAAHGFLVDSINHCVWTSSNEGISRIPLSMVMRGYKNKEGSNSIGFINHFGPDISTEFNGGSNISALKLADTCLVFANARGLVYFDPRDFSRFPLPKAVLVEDTEEEDEDDNLELGSTNHLQFTAIAPYYGDPGDIEISYHLTGSDNKWHELPENAIISYNNISPGQHLLQFRVRNYHSLDDPGKIINSGSFYIAPRWYQTTWFKILAVLFVASLLVLGHHLRTRALKYREKKMAELVKTKTAELQETNENLIGVIEELSQSEANLKRSSFLKDEYYAVLTHDLRSPLKFLAFNIGQLLELMPGIASERLREGLVASYECSNDLYKLIDEFVYWIQANEQQLKVQPVITNLSAVVEDARKIYRFSLAENNNQFSASIPADMQFVTDTKILFIIIRNAIDNANKYTRSGQITVSAEKVQGGIELLFADNGSGIWENMVQELMKLQDEDIMLSYKSNSLGFLIMAKLIRRLGGRYNISSVKDMGTTLSIFFPDLSKEAPKKEGP